MSFKVTDLIGDIIKREGGYTNDLGGRTEYGISERANPEAWADNKVTEEEARQIYTQKYLVGPGFDQIADEHLRSQLVDFGVNSGPSIAIKALQEILGVEVDGVLGPATIGAMKLVEPAWLNNQIMASRLRLFARLVSKRPSQVKFLVGWVNRALEFLL